MTKEINPDTKQNKPHCSNSSFHPNNKPNIEQRQTLTAGLLLFSISTFMAIFIIIGATSNPLGFINYMGINKTALEIPLAWAFAISIAVCYIAYTAFMIPLVRQNLFNFSCWLKFMGIYAAFSSGIVEELVFRQMLMDWLDTNKIQSALQIIISGITFGVIHLSWAIFSRNIHIGTCSTISTIILGLGLATTYIIADRNVLPAITAHTLINLFIEPWLILNAVRPAYKR